MTDTIVAAALLLLAMIAWGVHASRAKQRLFIERSRDVLVGPTAAAAGDAAIGSVLRPSGLLAPALARIGLAAPKLERPRALLRSAGLRIDALDALVLTAILGALATLSAARFGIGASGAASAGALAAVLAWTVVAAASYRRTRKLELQLADTIDLVVTGIRSGFPVTDALAVARDEGRQPLAGELGELLARLRIGQRPEEALEAFARSAGSPSARLFASTLAVQWGIGGELAPTLSHVARWVRERGRIEGRVRTLTGQARFTAAILFLMPYFIGALTWMRDPSGIRYLFVHPMGSRLVQWALILQALGVIWIYRMTRVRL